MNQIEVTWLKKKYIDKIIKLFDVQSRMKFVKQKAGMIDIKM
jgi:hypothetical protein